MTEAPKTPREIVAELDRYIVGQADAKRSVAVALRNRWRRMQVPEDLRDEISPKNIIMIGPTGVGKTEISRRLAKLAQAPFVKVEASRFTEVGYVGRDVESIVRDLTELAVDMVRAEETAAVEAKAREAAENRVIEILIKGDSTLFGDSGPKGAPETDTAREHLRQMLREGKLNEQTVEVDSSRPSGPGPMFEVISADDLSSGFDFKETFSKVMDGMNSEKRDNGKTRRISVEEAVETFAKEEAQGLIDQEAVAAEAVRRVEGNGIVFIDEIDKICTRDSGQSGPDVSRAGVQRDLLPIVEGSSIKTRYGMVRTDHILFIAAGAFNISRPSDLIPEFQGRFPVRVELQPLSKEDFVRILREPHNSLVKQYTALLHTEKVTLEFDDSAVDAMATIAADVNARTENVGARRLHTIMERLLEEISFEAPEKEGTTLSVDAAYVQERLGPVLEDQDLSRYIL